MPRKIWSREELVVAFNLYCKIPFSKISYKNPLVIELANLIKRTPSAVALKLVNYASLDPEIQKRNIKGMRHCSKADAELWEEFNNNPEKFINESETVLAKYKNKSLYMLYDPDGKYKDIKGKEKESLIMTRINQSFFRSTILASYNSKCCITGISIPELLIASHIIPWSVDTVNRLNPHNGICLNPLHDRAFDKGFITITSEYKVKLSPRLRKLKDKATLDRFFLPYDDMQINLPQRFFPGSKFLEYHNKNIFLAK